MSEHDFGNDAASLEPIRQGDLQRDQRRLQRVECIDRPGVEKHVAKRPVDVGAEAIRPFVDRCAEPLALAYQIARHPDPLAPLTGEDEDHGLLRCGGGVAAKPVGPGFLCGEALELVGEIRMALCKHDRSLVEVTSSPVQRVGEVVEIVAVPIVRPHAVA